MAPIEPTLEERVERLERRDRAARRDARDIREIKIDLLDLTRDVQDLSQQLETVGNRLDAKDAATLARDTKARMLAEAVQPILKRLGVPNRSS